MIFLLHGTDTFKSKTKLNDLVKKLLQRKPNAMTIRFNEEEFQKTEFLDQIESIGLFENNSIVVLDSILKNTENKDVVLENLKELKDSENIFIILEEKLDKKTLTKLSKFSEKVQEFNLVKKEEKNKFNIFSLSDALGNRNRKKLWVIYQNCKNNNISDEEVHGILFWSLKSLILSKNSNGAKESGLNPFVFKKNLKFSENYSNEELENLMSKLISLYHDARRGIKPLDIALEQFVLRV